MNGIIACDLDGTLAYQDGWHGPEHIGEPIPLMLARVLQWIKEGNKVCIFTARVSETNPNKDISREAIKKWCIKHIGQELEITADKKMEFVTFFDDKAIHVGHNTGIIS